MIKGGVSSSADMGQNVPHCSSHYDAFVQQLYKLVSEYLTSPVFSIHSVSNFAVSVTVTDFMHLYCFYCKTRNLSWVTKGIDD